MKMELVDKITKEQQCVNIDWGKRYSFNPEWANFDIVKGFNYLHFENPDGGGSILWVTKGDLFGFDRNKYDYEITITAVRKPEPPDKISLI